jgi:uncharacterized membrane protein
VSEARDAVPPDESRSGPVSAERLKAFTDAVVAIAMTLLILPLMESVFDASREDLTAGEWVADNAEPLISFALSFVLIAAFWMSHHRLFAHVHRVTGTLLTLSIAWMFTIVWLPVATAVVGLLPDTLVQKALYIGALFLTSAMSTVLGLYVLRHPELHSRPERSLLRGILADAVATALFVVAFLLSVLVPVLGYWAMAVLVLIGPVHAILQRLLGLSDPPAGR